MSGADRVVPAIMGAASAFVAAATSLPAVVRTAATAPRRVLEHPKALDVRNLLRSGWRVTAIDISDTPVRAAIRLTDGASERIVADNDLAFVVYAASLRPSDLASKESS